MKNPWKTLSSKIVYKNNYFQIRDDEVIRPNGEKGSYQVIEYQPSVMIVAINSKQEVYLVGQYRYATGRWSWEVPGGGTDGQDVVEAARRELQEETGLIARSIEDLGGNYVMNGTVNKLFHTILAKDVTQTNENAQDEEGIMEMKVVPFKNVLEMIKNGEITDTETIAALMLAGLKLELL